MTTEATKHTLDAVSVVTVVGTLADILTAVAALFTIIWTGIRIVETLTFRSIFRLKPLDKE